MSVAQRLIGHIQEALALGMWCLAIAGAWLRRKSGRPVLALLLLAFSPFLMLVILAYGQEGVLRVYLFSLPWTAALAALALAPFPAAEGELKAEGARTAEGARKPAQALATALWVPRSESQDADQTVIFHRVAADELGQVAALGVPGADAPAGQAGLRQAGTSGALPRTTAGYLPRSGPKGIQPRCGTVGATPPGDFSPGSSADTPRMASGNLACPGRRGTHCGRYRGRAAWGVTLVGELNMTVRPLVTLRILLVLGVALAMFFVAFFGDDGFNNMPQTEVATVTSFLEKAVPGPVYDPIADAPLADTARYNQFPTTDIFGAYGITGGASATGTSPTRSQASPYAPRVVARPRTWSSHRAWLPTARPTAPRRLAISPPCSPHWLNRGRGSWSLTGQAQ